MVPNRRGRWIWRQEEEAREIRSRFFLQDWHLHRGIGVVGFRSSAVELIALLTDEDDFFSVNRVQTRLACFV